MLESEPMRYLEFCSQFLGLKSRLATRFAALTRNRVIKLVSGVFSLRKKRRVLDGGALDGLPAVLFAATPHPARWAGVGGGIER